MKNLSHCNYVTNKLSLVLAHAISYITHYDEANTLKKIEL